MAQARRLQAFIETVPADQREAAQRILERIPPAQQPLAIQIIQRIIQQSGDRAPDALLHLEGIVSSENFRPHHLTTVSLLVRRAGPNTPQALRELGQIIDHEKFNRFVLMTVNLSLTRAGEDSHEALRALRFLLSNPNFTQRSLNIALPEMFVRHLDTAIRSGGDAPYMAIRAMAGIIANPSFRPSDFSVRSARAFGECVRTVIAESGPNRFHALEALETLYANSAIRPADITPEAARRLAQAVNHAIEYTRPNQQGSAVAGSEIDQSVRALNLVLGNRSFSLAQMAEDGLFLRGLGRTTRDIHGFLRAYNQFLRASRGHPDAAEAFRLVLEAPDRNPRDCLVLLNSALSNPSLAAIIGFPQRFAALAARALAMPETTEAGSATGSSIPRASREMMNAVEDALSPLVIILSSPLVDQAVFGRLEALLARPGIRPALALSMVGGMIERRETAASDLDAGFFSNVASLSAILPALSPSYHAALSRIFALPHFSPAMIAPGGIIDRLVRNAPPEDIGEALHALYEILLNHGAEAALGGLLSEIVRSSGAHCADSLVAFRSLYTGGLTSLEFPAVSALVREAGVRSPEALWLYRSVSENPNLRSEARSPGFAVRIASLARRLGRTAQAREQAARYLVQVLDDRRFTPGLVESLEFVFRTAGPAGTLDVLRYLDAFSRDPELAFPRMLDRRYLEFLISTAGAINRLGGARAAEINQALANTLASLGDEALMYMEHTTGVRQYLESVARGAGARAPEALLAAVPLLRHALITDEAAERLGRWIASYLEGADAAQLASRISQLQSFSGSGTTEMIDLVLDNPRLYQQGLTLARRLIGDDVSPTVAANFALGIRRIGEARVAQLYQTFGIRHFERYSDAMLERLTARARGERPTRPAVFVAFPHSDYNGAFYQQGRVLDQLLPQFDLIIYERGDEEGFNQAAADFRRRYGRIDTMILGGHGTPQSITLGSDMESGMIDLTDTEELRSLRPLFSDSPQIILISCSTGANDGSIGAVISTELGGILSAPRVPAGVREYRVNGHVISPIYTRASGLFVAGRDLRDVGNTLE